LILRISPDGKEEENMETLMTVDEVAGITKLAAATVRKYVLRKTIPFVKIGAAVRFKPSEIEKWISGKNEKLGTSNEQLGGKEPDLKEGELFPLEELGV
jgi:excisionase family DNA binding protein